MQQCTHHPLLLSILHAMCCGSQQSSGIDTSQVVLVCHPAPESTVHITLRHGISACHVLWLDATAQDCHVRPEGTPGG